MHLRCVCIVIVSARRYFDITIADGSGEREVLVPHHNLPSDHFAPSSADSIHCSQEQLRNLNEVRLGSVRALDKIGFGLDKNGHRAVRQL